ncbi:MAG: metallophosphoesterase [Bacteroidota bacterium]|nr:metallophosphoesterase [Bacteroidota bacterium]
MNDFRVIKFNNIRLSTTQYNQLHFESLSFINSTISENNDCTNVVITHHAPTLLNYPPQYKNTILNEAFAVELYDLIEQSNIDYWIYGHHHCNIPDFSIGKTMLLTNQLGYVAHGEHRVFENDKVIAV